VTSERSEKNEDVCPFKLSSRKTSSSILKTFAEEEISNVFSFIRLLS